MSATLWTVAHQAPLSTGFSRQEYWSGLPSPSPGDLPKPWIKPMSLTSPALAGGFCPPGKPTIIITTQKSLFFIQKYILSTFFSRHWEYKNEQKEVCCLESSHPTKRYKAIAIGKATLSLYWKREGKLLLLTNYVSLCTAVYIENR